MSICGCQLRDAGLLRDAASSARAFAVLDPASGSILGSVPDHDAAAARAAIATAHAALSAWRALPAKHRHDALIAWHRAIIDNEHNLATLISLESGKVLAEAVGEVRYGAAFIEWFAEESRRVYGDVIPAPSAAQRFVVVKEPVGVCSIITPWNFPNAMITRKAGAALAAGCTVVVKPSAETPFSAIALATLAHRAGIPPGVINVVTTEKNLVEVGEELVQNPLVRKVSFTGSTAIGKHIMQRSASNLLRVSLELGGNAPFIVFDDADINAAVDGLLTAKFRNSGQTCVCANRIYIQSGIYDAFAEKLSARVKSEFRLGHALDDGVTHGPLIHAKAVQKVQRHVSDALSRGGTVLCGAQNTEGNFYAPTVIRDATDDMIIAKEEVFGPVAALFRFATEEEVIARANDSSVGLAAYFFSRDIGRVWRVSEAIQVGMVGANTGVVSSEIAPFGGVKQSGLGREGSKYGIDEYLNIKMIAMGL